eukprot:6436563-Prymnesium_polylepis.1
MLPCSVPQLVAANSPWWLPSLDSTPSISRGLPSSASTPANCSDVPTVWFPSSDFGTSGHNVGWPQSDTVMPNVGWVLLRSSARA